MGPLKGFAACSATLAAISLAATPLAAAELPGAARVAVPDYAAPAVFDEDSLTAERYRHRGYRGYRGGHHRHHVSTGDVLAGVLIIGGIAAIASAASNSERRDRDVRYRDYRDDRDVYRDRRTTRRSGGGRGIEGAVDMCLAEIERDVRVESVDSVDRSGEGWRVVGTIFNGDRFTCEIGEGGRIERVDYGGGLAAAAPAEGSQYSDDRYGAAWAQVDGGAGSSPAGEDAEQLPAYPGGPIDGDLAEEDDRYRIAEAPAG